MPLSALPPILDDWRDLIHPAALLLPRPSDTEYASLRASIEERGVLQPLSTFVDLKGENWLIDGISRLQAMVELGMPILDQNGQWAIDHTSFYEEKGDDPYALALSLNLARRHLTNEQKRDVVAELLQQRPDLSDRAIARMADVSPHTVASERLDPEPEPEPVDEPATGEEGEEEDEPEEDEPEEDEPERVEETGRRARGPRTGATRGGSRAEPAPVASGPFIGTVPVNANKNTRIAEARRCVKWLGLEVEDLLPRRRTVH